MQAISDIKLREFLSVLSDTQLLNLFSRRRDNNFHLARIWHHLNESQKIYLINNIIDSTKIEAILNIQPESIKQADYEIARQHFEKAIREQHEEETANNLLTVIDKARNITPLSDLPLLTEFTHRAAVSLTDPNNDINNRRCEAITDKMSHDSSRKILKGALLLLGVGLITTAILLTPLSGSVIYLGTQLSSAAIAALTTGGALTLTVACDYLTQGIRLRKLSNAAHRFFNRAEEDFSIPIVPDRNGSVNSVDSNIGSDRGGVKEALLRRAISRGRPYLSRR